MDAPEPIELPPLVRARAEANGAAGRRWIESLPTVVEALCEQWGLRVGSTYPGGTAGYVADAVGDDGRPYVLKIAMPLDLDEERSFARSVHAHRLAAGRGCVAMYEADLRRHALLLERLGPNLDGLGCTVDEILLAVADTLPTFWRPVADPSALRSGVEQARWLAAYVERTWRELDGPCERALVDRAIELCERRIAAFDPARAVLVHGDAHGWNTVSAGDGTYRFVDPDGLWSEPEHDLAVPMREYGEPLLAGDTPALVGARAELLATRCGVDPQAVWEWGFVERVSTGLANARDFAGTAAAGDEFFEVARRCL